MRRRDEGQCLHLTGDTKYNNYYLPTHGRHQFEKFIDKTLFSYKNNQHVIDLDGLFSLMARS